MGHSVEDELVRALEAKGAKALFRADEDQLVVTVNDKTLKVSLDNARRRVAMGDSVDHVVCDFVSALLEPRRELDTAGAVASLRLMLEQGTVIEGTDTLTKPVSAEVAAIVVSLDRRASRIKF